jgi:transcriptional regulator with XRE-family HTH domain
MVGGKRVSGPTARRRYLGRALRKARKEANLTQSAVAKELNCGQGKINKIETTLVAISMDELDKLITIYRVPAERAAELRDLASQDQAEGPRRTALSRVWSAFEQLRDREQDASEILCWHSERIPKPLQSEFYMLQQHQDDVRTTADVVRLIRQLEARSRIFTIDNPPRYRVILSESSLRRMPGGAPPRLVVDQVEHLLGLMSTFAHFTLQILTFAADVAYVDTDFQVLRFGGEEPDFCYIEGAGGAKTFERAEEVRMFADHWQELHEAALDQNDTKLFLEELVTLSKLAWDAEEKC